MKKLVVISILTAFVAVPAFAEGINKDAKCKQLIQAMKNAKQQGKSEKPTDVPDAKDAK